MNITGPYNKNGKSGIFPKMGNFSKIFGNLIGSINMEVEKMGRVQTSVMIDEDKRALAKQRGLKLQDLLDKALDMALDLEVKGKAQLEIEKDNILKEIELKGNQKKEYLKNYNMELERLEKQLQELEEKKDKVLEMNQNDINELNLRLQYNEKALAGAVEEQREINQLKEYKDIVLRGVKNGAIDGALDVELQDHCIKYNLPDLNAIYLQASKDLTSIFYNKLTIDDITLDYKCFKPYVGSDE